jgi:hypothetical protein
LCNDKSFGQTIVFFQSKPILTVQILTKRLKVNDQNLV